MPTDEQIRAWIKSDQVSEWMEKKLSFANPQWEEAVDKLIKKVIHDKNHDHTIRNNYYPQVALGINVLTWTLWISIRYKNGIILAPDCPFKLEDFIGQNLLFREQSTNRKASAS